MTTRHWIVLAGLMGWAVSASAEPTPEMKAAQDFSKAFRAVARSAGPAVVSITMTRIVKAAEAGPDMEDFLQGLPAPFRRYAPPQGGGGFEQRGQGSGVIVDAAKGTILTNHHVVEGVDRVKVHLRDGREVEGKVVGSDPKTDIAVVRIEAKDLQAAPLGDSDALEVGDWVVAIGAPFGLEQTMTAGIVSAKGRADVNVIHSPYAEQDFIQTDAAINPGNSGGPLLNLCGEVVGINTAIAGAGVNAGVGFTVPSKLAKRVMLQLLEKGKVVRGWIGVMVQELTPEVAERFGVKQGVVLGKVMPGAPAAAGGLESGDVILAIGDQAVTDTKDLRRLVSQAEVGAPLAVRVLRDGKERTLAVTVGEQPGEGRPGVASVDRPETEALGLSVQSLTPELADPLGLDAGEKGVVVTRVAPGSLASDKGLRPGALIQSVDRKPVGTPAEFRKAVAGADLAKGVLLLVKQGEAASWIVLKSP